MNLRLVFALVGVLALLAGTALYLGSPRPEAGPAAVPVEITPGALLATRFTDRDGKARTIGEFQGQVVVLNFWATWCAPCREEMPGFSRLQARWGERGVRFVGVSDEERPKVDHFAQANGIAYPLWTGDAEVMALSGRLGNRLGVLPHTVLLDAQGRVLESRIGVYPENLLEKRLAAIAGKSG